MVNEKQLYDQRVRDYARQARKDAAKPPHDDGYHYRIFGIHKIRSDQTFRFTHAKIAANDPRLRDKLVMVQMAKDIQTQSLKINGYDPALSYAIRAAIQGEPPLFHWLGEFFQNYGMFQAVNLDMSATRPTIRPVCVQYRAPDRSFRMGAGGDLSCA